MADNIKFNIGIFYAVIFFVFFLNLCALFIDKGFQPRSIFWNILTPIIVKLETGEMIRAVINGF